MTATKPSTIDILKLAEERTAAFGYPKEPPTDGRSLDLYRQQRADLLDRQIANARIELEGRYERELAREREAADRAKRDAAAFEADLHERFRRQFPGAPESDFATARPALLAQIADEQRNADDAARTQARTRVRI